MKPRRRLRLQVTFAALREAGDWRPLPGCPGRWVLPGPRAVSPADLVGQGVPVRVHEVPGARDPVHVAVVPGGGLISYARADGRFVHTLNDDEGLRRKLEQLGVPCEPAP
ncbi:MAG: hypothetical protein D6731_05595 [Planctomycetota bacterium]|nr:MAG: hypothetical protein D6731_05595 [Planctomycetota bacterium]